jgi:hypothetical protein
MAIDRAGRAEILWSLFLGAVMEKHIESSCPVNSDLGQEGK